MADVTATAHVFPSANDLEGGQPNGWGETLYEKNLSTFWLASLGVNNFTFSGAILPASSVNLTLQIPSGKFWLDGHFVDIAATNITFPASSTSYIFAKLLKDVNGNVSSVAYEHNTTGTAPADATPIGTAITDLDNVTSTEDTRLMGPHGMIVLIAGTGWIVRAGLYRLFVEVFGASGGGGGGAEATTNSGGAGGSGGTTSFSSMSATGGAGGAGGHPNGSSAGGASGANHGSGSGGTINLTGHGLPSGRGGMAGGDAQNGGSGGDGGYAAAFFNVTPGQAIAIAIGANGTPGVGGSGGPGADGGAGSPGLNGVIKLHY